MNRSRAMPRVTGQVRIRPVASVANFSSRNARTTGSPTSDKPGGMGAAETVEDDGSGGQGPVDPQREVAQLPDRRVGRDRAGQAVERQRRAAGGHGLRARKVAFPEREDGVALILLHRALVLRDRGIEDFEHAVDRMLQIGRRGAPHQRGVVPDVAHEHGGDARPRHAERRRHRRPTCGDVRIFRRLEHEVRLCADGEHLARADLNLQVRHHAAAVEARAVAADVPRVAPAVGGQADDAVAPRDGGLGDEQHARRRRGRLVMAANLDLVVEDVALFDRRAGAPDERAGARPTAPVGRHVARAGRRRRDGRVAVDGGHWCGAPPGRDDSKSSGSGPTFSDASRVGYSGGQGGGGTGR